VVDKYFEASDIFLPIDLRVIEYSLSTEFLDFGNNLCVVYDIGFADVLVMIFIFDFAFFKVKG